VRSSRKKEMRRLIDHVVGNLGLPIPTEPDVLFAALIREVGKIRQREIRLLKEPFPPQTASGLWLRLETYDLVVVDSRATPLHQLAILGHELGHMLLGKCGQHDAAQAVAGQLKSTRGGIDEALEVAARTRFDDEDERRAETFALIAVTQTRQYLEGTPFTAPHGIAGRIGKSLGHRRPQV
jgi:hypothetical protein